MKAIIKIINPCGNGNNTIKEFNNIQIQYLPAAVYAYNVGKNTLESQK